METIITARAIVAIARCASPTVSAPKRYVVVPTFVQPLDRNREVASVNFCPLDIDCASEDAQARGASLWNFPVDDSCILLRVPPRLGLCYATHSHSTIQRDLCALSSAFRPGPRPTLSDA